MTDIAAYISRTYDRRTVKSRRAEYVTIVKTLAQRKLVTVFERQSQLSINVATTWEYYIATTKISPFSNVNLNFQPTLPQRGNVTLLQRKISPLSNVQTQR